MIMDVDNNQKELDLVDLTTKLGRKKSQRTLLQSSKQSDILTSIRPKVGKKFSNAVFEREKCECLERCRQELIDIAIKEADLDIQRLLSERNQLLIDIQDVLHKFEYSKLTKTLKRKEQNTIESTMVKHRNKFRNILNKDSPPPNTPPSNLPPNPTISKPVKHIDTINRKKAIRNKKSRLKAKQKRNARLNDRLNHIKADGLVVNFTEMVIPDSALLFLAKGFSFVPSVNPSKHSLIYDTNEFLRKLAWRTHFHLQSQLPGSSNTVPPKSVVEEKLRLPSHEWPPLSNKLFDHVSDKLKHFVNSLEYKKPKLYNNLTFLEREGLFWCIKMQREGKLHFSQADKGGATVIMDPTVVDNVIQSKLNDVTKFERLVGDPRSRIDNSLLSLCKDQLERKGLSERELFLITGHTGKGKSHNPLFKAGKPNPFPLFKLHSLSEEDLNAKTIPPIRLVTSMKFSATKRLSLFIDSLLNPIAQAFCGISYIKDTPDFLRKLAANKSTLSSSGVQLFTLDVKGLYPSINPDFVPNAIEYAIDIVTDFSEARKHMIVELVKFSISNACVHYRDVWYRMIEGIPTGGSDSVVIANILVKWVIIKFKVSPSATCFKSYVGLYFRFIDDLFGSWSGSYRQFKYFIEQFNKFGKLYGVIFDKESFGDRVNFLDVLISNSCGEIVTDLFVKPTDARRYLHTKSFHPKHTFSGIPFSQMRRAALICSNDYLRDFAISRMIEAFLQCGYKEANLNVARLQVQKLKRSDLLLVKETPVKEETPLVFTLPYGHDSLAIKEFLHQFENDFNLLTGPTRLVFSYKRNENVGAMLLNKFGFANLKKNFLSQKCGSPNCSCCSLFRPSLEFVDVTLNWTIKPDKSLNCKSECVIYVAICKVCSDFYIGKTMTPMHIRMNGHRDKFNKDKFDKSALAMHIFNDHPDAVGYTPTQGLANFELFLIESTNAINLRQREDFYIWRTEAEIRHLNRYKVSR